MLGESVKIFQIAYDSATLRPTDPEFLIYDCVADPAPEYRETYHFRKFFEKQRHLEADYTGLLSPRFGEKTRTTIARFHHAVRINPGYDVYFVNPAPWFAYLAHNIWDYAQETHPEIREVANQVFAHAGMSIDVSKLPRNSHDTLLFCNYWVGNHRFWSEFTDWIGRLDRAAQAQRVGPIYPYLFECYFSTFLTQRSDIRAFSATDTFAEFVPRLRSRALQALLAQWGPLIDGWDRRGVPFTEDQKNVLRSLYQTADLYVGADNELGRLAAEVSELRRRLLGGEARL